MPQNRLTPTAGKQFDARTARIIVQNGNSPEPVRDIESFGFDQSKDHSLEYTIDQEAIWVKSTPELTGSFVMKATSPSIPIVENAFLNDQQFSITAQLGYTAGGSNQDQVENVTSDDDGQNVVQFTGCMLTSFSMSDYEIDGMPTYTAEWQGVNRAGQTPSYGQFSGADGFDQELP